MAAVRWAHNAARYWPEITYVSACVAGAAFTWWKV